MPPSEPTAHMLIPGPRWRKIKLSLSLFFSTQTGPFGIRLQGCVQVVKAGGRSVFVVEIVYVYNYDEMFYVRDEIVS